MNSVDEKNRCQESRTEKGSKRLVSIESQHSPNIKPPHRKKNWSFDCECELITWAIIYKCLIIWAETQTQTENSDLLFHWWMHYLQCRHVFRQFPMVFGRFFGCNLLQSYCGMVYMAAHFATRSEPILVSCALISNATMYPNQTLPEQLRSVQILWSHVMGLCHIHGFTNNQFSTNWCETPNN